MRRPTRRCCQGRDEVKHTAYVVITADRGLCGGYNAGTQRAAEGEIKADLLPGRDYTVIPVGRKALGYFRFRGYQLGQEFNGFSDQPSYEDARRPLASTSSTSSSSGQVDRVELVYTRFISSGSQEVVLRPLVPLSADTVAGGDGKAGDGTSATTTSSPTPKPSSTRCCPATSRPVSMLRCSTQRRPSMRSVSGR